LDAKPKFGNVFNEDLSAALVVSNIPRNKLQIPEFKNFLKKYTGKHIPDECTLRKNYLGPCYDNVIIAIREVIGSAVVRFCEALVKSLELTTITFNKLFTNQLKLKFILLFLYANQIFKN
jgi:hypothetical protein